MIAQSDVVTKGNYQHTVIAVKAPYLPKQSFHTERKTLVLDLDETLVHSTLQPNENTHLRLPINADNELYYIYVSKRPGLDEFLKRVSQLYEVVIFTASLPKYANKLINTLDVNGYVSYRLFREHCKVYNNVFIKDLQMLGRRLESVIIVDNSPNAYLLQPENALPISTWVDDRSDKSLYELIPVLEKLVTLHDVRKGLSKIVNTENEAEVDYKKAARQLKKLQYTPNAKIKPRKVKSALLLRKHERHGTLRQKSLNLMKKLSKVNRSNCKLRVNTPKKKTSTKRSASNAYKSNKLCLDLSKRQHQAKVDSRSNAIPYVKNRSPSSTHSRVKGGSFIHKNYFIDVKCKAMAPSSILNIRNLTGKNSFSSELNKKGHCISKCSNDKRKLFKCLGGVRSYI